MKSEEISVTEEEVPETEQVDVDSSDKVERIKKAASAYRMESSIEGVKSGTTKIIPSKENFESSVRLTVDATGLSKVVTEKEIKRGDLLEECFYYVMESRKDDFFMSLRDKVAAYVMWTLPEDDSVYKSDEVGNHVILPLGNALAYGPSYTPNAYVQFDSKMRVIRFYALRDINRGEVVTIGYPKDGVGPSGITPQQYYELTGDTLKSKIGSPGKKGGCSSCQQKKFRSRIEEKNDNIQET